MTDKQATDMTAQVTLTLSDKLYKRARKLARKRQSKMADALIEHLEETLALEDDQQADGSQPQHTDALYSVQNENRSF